MSGKGKYSLLLCFIILFMLPRMEAKSETSGDERLDSFYATEYKKFNKKLEKHNQQIDKCLNEMNKFEKGDILLKPIECLKFDEMRQEVASIIEEIKVVYESYKKWLKTPPADKAITRSETASNMTFALLQMYTVKFEKVLIQTKRIREKEDNLIKGFNEFRESLKTFDGLEENGDINNNKPIDPAQ